MGTSQLEPSKLAAETDVSRSDPTDDVIDVLDLLIILARNKRLIITCAMAAAVVAATVSLLLPNRYTATTTIMPPQQTQSTASMLMTHLASSGLGSLDTLAGGPLGLKNPNDLYIALLKSRRVEDALVAQFGFEKIFRKERLSDARKVLEDASSITSSKEGLINISFEDKDPKRSAEVANAYVAQLRLLTKDMAFSEASQRRIFFEQQVSQAKEDLTNAEADLQQTQQKTGFIEPDKQSRAIIEAIAAVRSNIAAKEVQLRAMRSFATEQNPDYVLADQELSGLRVQLTKLEQGQGSSKGDPLVATGKIPVVELEYIRRYREVKYREALFDLMAKQYEAAKLDEAKDAAVIQVVDTAVPPDKKSWPHRAVIVMVAILGGIVFGSILVLAGEVSERVLPSGRLSRQIADLKFYVLPKKHLPKIPQA